MNELNNNATEVKTLSDIKVKIQIPEKVGENIRQQKINKLYDILKPKNIA